MPMPPMQLSASSSASATSKGGDGAFGGTTSTAIQQGDWNISNGSSAAVGSSAINPLYILGAGLAWLLLRKRV